ncbi:hypothetical protein N8009_05795 [Flavobacteriaceae bacterium]|nr:hypothetical protein [Flavobacteriaceae bacterium]
MNKSFLILPLFICFYFSVQSQNDTPTIFEKHHEVKVGVVKILAGPIFEGTYEYIKDRNMGYGATLLVNFDTNNDYFENFSVTPFFRMYFDRDEQYGAKGFFVESFLSLYSGDDDSDEYDNLNTAQNNYFDTALGFSIGQKWINSGGFIFEIKLGVGRNLLGDAPFDAVFKGDFCIGYRF